MSLLAITGPELAEAVPVILSLIVIEGLLSVDNALAIAAMASHLPGRQKILALRLGIIGAYVFRGIALACASLITANPWLKIIGAAYLVHLMCSHFAENSREEDDGCEKCKSDALARMSERGFIATIASIEFMDLSLSVDNVVAAVVMSPKLWVVCTGVFIGILALRLVAGFCIKLIERYPILEHTAFLLIGYVGVLLIFELATRLDVHAVGKFVGIVVIVGLSILYSNNPRFAQFLSPLIKASGIVMRAYATIARFFIGIITYPCRTLIRVCRKNTSASDETA